MADLPSFVSTLWRFIFHTHNKPGPTTADLAKKGEKLLADVDSLAMGVKGSAKDLPDVIEKTTAIVVDATELAASKGIDVGEIVKLAADVKAAAAVYKKAIDDFRAGAEAVLAAQPATTAPTP